MGNTEKVALVTGGAGFIGSHLAEELVKQGYKVKVLDNLIKGKLESIQHIVDKGDIIFIEGDVRNRDVVDRAMKDVNYVFHTAGIHIKQSISSTDEAIDVNVKGSYNVFRSAMEHSVKRVIFSSSASIYGNTDLLPMSENNAPNIIEPYGASKFMCENILKFLGTKGLNYNILRYFNVYGSRQAVHAYYTTVVIHFINRIMNDEAPVIDGKGDQTLDFVHVSDVVRANILAAESDVVNEVFNIGTGVSTSVSQLATSIIKILGKDIEPIFCDKEVFAPKRQANMTKAKDLLGFTAQVKFEEGIQRVAREISQQLGNNKND